MEFDSSARKQVAALDAKIREWWDQDLHCAGETEIRDDPDKTLLFLPHPYITPGGSGSAFPEMYCWDTHFINLGLFAHDRLDLVRNHIVNQLFMIERNGMVLNGNRTYYLTRSQTPLLSESLRLYFDRSGDTDLLHMAYPLLKQEYRGYWLAGHHRTSTGLANNNDLGDPTLRPELAAEAEITDFSACFAGDVRQCNPVITNSALVKYARNLAFFAEKSGLLQETSVWRDEAESRAGKIREFCWDEEKGFFFDYHVPRKQRLPYWSLCGYWPLWAGIASREQADRMVENLDRFKQPHGLAQTDIAYPSPHPEFQWVQWGYPAGWPTMQIVVVEGLIKYGFAEKAREIASSYLALILNLYRQTGELWEKYNVTKGNLEFPVERYTVPPMHGWTSATVVLFGKQIFNI